MYDTGAGASVVRQDIFDAAVAAGMRFRKRPTMSLSTVSKKPLKVTATVETTSAVRGRKIKAIWNVSPEIPYEAVMGLNIIKKFFCQKGDKIVWLADENIVASVECKSDKPDVNKVTAVSSETDVNKEWWSGMVCVKRNVALAPHEARKVSIFIRADSDNRRIKTGEVFCEVDGLSGLTTLDEDGFAHIFVENRSDQEKLLKKNSVIGVAWQADNKFVSQTMQPFPVADAVIAAAQKTQRPPKKLQEFRWKLVKPMADAALKHIKDKAIKGKMYGLFRKYVDVFSRDKFDIGRTKDGSHTIRLKNQEPVFTKQFPLPVREMEFIREHVKQWEKLGLVEPANSPYNSPIFCVAKKGDAGWRLVLDYRRLNAQSHVDRYSIRGVDECLIEVGMANSKWFSTLDLTSGFWQLPLDPKAKPWTAFTVPGVGQYQWTMAPMGLQGSPASFSRLMDKVMFDAPNTVTFIDDILIHSKSQSEQVQHLDTALSRLAKSGLKLNLPKCIFMKQEVPYLGHTLTAEGIKPGLDKWKALVDTRPPTDLPSLRSFLGLANFFRKFVADYSRKAAPLHKLTRQDNSWHKGPLPAEAMAAFQKLKEDIATAPPLRLPSSTGTFHLFVDGATGSAEPEGPEGGLGACLLQDNDGTFKPVAFASRSLEKHEKNYSATTIELAAMVYSMEHFAPLLKGRRFYLYTDHKPLVTMSATQQRTHCRLTDRIEGQFEYDLRYTPGGRFNPADFLSRTAAQREKDATAQQEKMANTSSKASTDPKEDHTHAIVAALEGQAIKYPPWSMFDLQEKDPTIRQIKLAIQNKAKWPPRYRAMAKKMVINNGHVGYNLDPRPGFPNDKRFRVLPPENMWKRLLKEAHDDTLAGHGGQFRTGERLRQMYWWPGLAADVAKHIKKCAVCDRVKKVTPRQSDMEVMPLRIPRRINSRIHADLWGPHLIDGGQKRWVCVITDALSKLVHLKLLKNKTAADVAEALNEWVVWNGVPEEVVTDQGKEFCNDVIKELWGILEVDHITTSPYHPRSNGAAERFNRTMLDFLTKTLAQHKEDSTKWPAFLPALQIAYNSGVHKGARCSPYEAHLGSAPNHPHWPRLDDLLEEPKPEFRNTPLVEAQLRRQVTRKTAQDMLYLQQSNMMRLKQNEDKRKLQWQPANGDKVWIRRHDINVPNPMLAQQWETATVLFAVRQGSYKVIRDDRKKRKKLTVSLQEMRPKVTDVPEEDLADEVVRQQEDLEEIGNIVLDAATQALNEAQATSPESIAAIEVSITQEAIDLIEDLERQYRKKGIQVLLSLTGELRTPATRPPPPTPPTPPPPPPATPPQPGPSRMSLAQRLRQRRRETPATPSTSTEGADSNGEEFFTPPERPTVAKVKKAMAKELAKLTKHSWKKHETLESRLRGRRQ